LHFIFDERFRIGNSKRFDRLDRQVAKERKRLGFQSR